MIEPQQSWMVVVASCVHSDIRREWVRVPGTGNWLPLKEHGVPTGLGLKEFLTGGRNNGDDWGSLVDPEPRPASDPPGAHETPEEANVDRPDILNGPYARAYHTWHDNWAGWVHIYGGDVSDHDASDVEDGWLAGREPRAFALECVNG